MCIHLTINAKMSKPCGYATLSIVRRFKRNPAVELLMDPCNCFAIFHYLENLIKKGRAAYFTVEGDQNGRSYKCTRMYGKNFPIHRKKNLHTFISTQIGSLCLEGYDVTLSIMISHY